MARTASSNPDLHRCLAGLLGLLLLANGCGGTISRLQDDEAKRPFQVVGLSLQSGSVGATVTFSALLELPLKVQTDDLDFSWDFGPLAVPQYSTAASPEVKLTGNGALDYLGTVPLSSARIMLRVSERVSRNEAQADAAGYPFTLYPAGYDPGVIEILGLNHAFGKVGQTLSFSALLRLPDGLEQSQLRYDWDFGPLAVPQRSSAASPQVTLTGDFGADFTGTGFDDFTIALRVWAEGSSAEGEDLDLPFRLYPASSTLPMSIKVLGLSHSHGKIGSQATLGAMLRYSPGLDPSKFTYHWEFGRLCNPQASFVAAPPVTFTGNFAVNATEDVSGETIRLTVRDPASGTVNRTDSSEGQVFVLNLQL